MTPTADDVKLTLTKREKPQDLTVPVPDFALADGAPYALYIRDTVASAIREYASLYSKKEVGGVLLGRHYMTGARTVVVIDGHRAIASGDSGVAHYTFDRKAQREIQMLPQTGSQYVVGWFHSHPSFGDPFMSLYDTDVHCTTFPKPWYVSCVIGGGQWSLPLGFWRMEQAKLIHIQSHFVIMTPVLSRRDDRATSTAIGEQNRRYVNACVGERPAEAFVRRMRVASELMVESTLGTDLAAALTDSDRVGSGENVAAPLLLMRVLVTAAARLAADDTAVADLPRLLDALQRVRFLDDALLTTFRSEELGTSLTCTKNTYVSAHQDEPRIVVCDQLLGLYLSVPLPQSTRLWDINLSADGTLWAALDGGKIARITATDLVVAARVSDPTFVPRVELLNEIQGGPVFQLCAVGDELVVRHETEIAGYRIGGHIGVPTVVRTGVTPAPLGAVLVPRFGGRRCGLLTKDGCDVTLWPDVFDASIKLRLPPGLRAPRLVAACECVLGVALLLEDGPRTPLALLSLADGLCVVYLPEGPNEPKLTSIATDVAGRLFVRRDIEVALLVASGSLESNA